MKPEDLARMVGNLMGDPEALRQGVERARKELARTVESAEAGGGVVRVEASAAGELVAVHVDPELVAEGDVEMIQDLLLVAANAALRRAREGASFSLGGLAGGLPFGGGTGGAVG